MSISPLSGWVLSAAGVVASPALWDSLVAGTMPLDVALTRFLIAVPVSWLLLTLVSELAFPRPGAVTPAESTAEDPPGTRDAGPETEPRATDAPAEVDPAA